MKLLLFSADPYQRAAATMLWPGYATPAQSPWHLPSEIPAHPHSGGPALWSRSSPLLHPLPFPAGFDLPLRTMAEADVKIEPLSSASPEAPCGIKDEIEEGKPFDPADYIRSFSPESAVRTPAMPLDPVVVKDEIQVVPDLEKPEAAESPEATESQADSQHPPIKQSPGSPGVNGHLPECVPSAGIDAAGSVEKKEEFESGGDPEFLGLRLLSESIEHFVSTKKQQESSIRIDPQDSGIAKKRWTQMDCISNPLDMLCAAALSQQGKESVLPATPSPVKPASARGCQPEFDFRSKLAELQRKYKEKQKELSNLSK